MIKQCPVCSITIDRNTKQYKQKVFCSVKCRKSAHRKKVSASTRIGQRRANLLQNKEVLYLVDQCRRAGTVQILTGHTIESFTQTMSLVRERPKGDVKLCHIAPVKGKNSIGLFHCQNLFYGGTYQNRQFGKRYIANGISIPHSKLKDKWRVSNKEATNEILIKIEKFLEGIVQSYIETTPVRKSKKYQIAQKILELSDNEDLENLMRSSYQELKDKWETVSHRKIFKIEHRPESKFLAYLDELSRFVTYGGTRKPMFRKIRDILIIGYMALERAKDSGTYNKYFYVKYEPLIELKYAYAKLINDSTWSNFKDLCYETAFFALQGGKVNTREFRNEFMSYLEFSKPNENPNLVIAKRY